MSHSSGGYFYYRYTYACPYTDAKGNRFPDDTYDTALYSSVPRQDHKEQTKWYKETFLQAAETDVTKNKKRNTNKNKQRRTNNQNQTNKNREFDFLWTVKPPRHDTG